MAWNKRKAKVTNSVLVMIPIGVAPQTREKGLMNLCSASKAYYSKEHTQELLM